MDRARRALLVQALFFEQRQIGFVVFELGAKRRLVFELLRGRRLRHRQQCEHCHERRPESCDGLHCVASRGDSVRPSRIGSEEFELEDSERDR